MVFLFVSGQRKTVLGKRLVFQQGMKSYKKGHLHGKHSDHLLKLILSLGLKSM